MEGARSRRATAALLSAGALLLSALVAHNVLYPRGGKLVLSAQHLAAADAAARLQSHQRRQLRGEERARGAQIETLAGKTASEAARMQALSELQAPGHGDAFKSFLQAAGAAGRMQVLAGTSALPAGGHGVRVNRLETKYHSLLAAEREEVRLKEREVTKIYDKEMTRLAGAGKEAEARLLRDEENAETTLLAQEKEAEIRKKLQAVKDLARLKSQQLQAQLASVRALARQYQQKVDSNKGMNASAKLNSRQDAGMPSDAATFAGFIDRFVSKQVDRKVDASSEDLAESKAEHRKRNEAKAHKAMLKAALATQARKKAAAALQAKAPAAKIKFREPASEHQKEPKQEMKPKVRCTDDSCPLNEMEQVSVVNRGKIHKMEQLAERGHGVAKSQALAMIRRMQTSIIKDYAAVTGFARHQEHVLDRKKVEKDTALMLGKEVALSLAPSASGTTLTLDGAGSGMSPTTL